MSVRVTTLVLNDAAIAGVAAFVLPQLMPSVSATVFENR